MLRRKLEREGKLPKLKLEAVLPPVNPSANEPYPGANSLEYDVKTSQISFYKWGTWVWRIAIVTFIVMMVLTSLCCILGIFGQVYLGALIKYITEQFSHGTQF